MDDGPTTRSSPPALAAARGQTSHWSRRRRSKGSRPLAATRATFAMLYAVDGAILPFFSVFLARAHGLSAGQIGLVLAIGGAASIPAPFLLSMLADRFGRAVRLLMLVLTGSALTLLAMTVADGYWQIALVYALFMVVHESARPLLDGVFFKAQRRTAQLRTVSYHRVRIWGTFGFMVPGVVIYFAMSDDTSLAGLPAVASGLALLAVVSAFHLPTRRAPGGAPEKTKNQLASSSLPELFKAAGALLKRPTTAVFVLAMFCMQTSFTAYSVFYPLHVTDVVGLAPRWLGLITNVGVFIELGYMAAFAWFVRRLGWRWLMVAGAIAAALRLVLLAALPTAGVAVGTQVVHGLVIIVLMVASRVVLDQQASSAIRHTAQGLFAMIVIGGGRIAGSAIGGLIAAHSISALFWSAAALSGFAAVLLAWCLRHFHSDHPT
ncbi:MFS transporter [Phytoactinopolyspora mesophila]|uniref:MFS transporter n=1 Tax=Phytoactinopolyspora mesophila TaxID=2650750 RepID=A0A7K3M3D9_9ACTN|nr:MFS transporter [Phytoactinopolyspora mesophila]NDL57547.1 MFS transporter [Phytoactinopolyspora mesophila]